MVTKSKPHRLNLGCPGNTGDSDAIVADPRCQAGTRCSVTIGTCAVSCYPGWTCLVSRVVTCHDVGSEIFMKHIDTLIDDGDTNRE